MGFILKGLAELDLEKIWKYTSIKWSVKQANKYIDEIHNSILYLSNNPKSCSENLEINPAVRIYPCQSHLIVYIINDNSSISIIRILHKRMDIRKNLDD